MVCGVNLVRSSFRSRVLPVCEICRISHQPERTSSNVTCTNQLNIFGRIYYFIKYPYVSLEDPAEIVIVEKYADEQALEYHIQTPYFKEGMGKLKDILAAPMEVEKFNEEPTMMVT